MDVPGSPTEPRQRTLLDDEREIVSWIRRDAVRWWVMTDLAPEFHACLMEGSQSRSPS